MEKTAEKERHIKQFFIGTVSLKVKVCPGTSGVAAK
nr:hypothetical protein [Mucilaginibacter sp. X4EP1]